MRPLVILGTAGNAYDVLDVVEAINAREPTWQVEGFLDDSRAPGSPHLGLKVLGPLSSAARFEGCFFINAIGSDRSYRQRPQLVGGLGLRREQFATLVHPLASVSTRARLGCGACVGYGVSVAGNVSIGDHVWLGPASVVGHDSEIGEHSMLAPAACVSGFVQVGTACYIGARAVIRGRVSIGEKALVGMGAVVVRDVAAGTTVVGNPARLLERRAAAPLISARG
jgi:sugar O-acyltransferase (sialic acid O-acetyltransferase NeuD family)